MNPEDEPDHEDAEGEDLDWITMNGTHIPLDENGTAVGGPVAGRTFSEAKSAKKGKAGEEKPDEGASGPTGGSATAPKREPVQGKDISTSYDGPKDIKSVIHAQGFDGLPKVVSKEEFDKAVKASNFIAQRTYSASSQEILDEYQNQLYNGDWYVECSEGGAQYGQGMYCAADYTGALSEGIKAEMEHYRTLGESRSTKFIDDEQIDKATEARWNKIKDNVSFPFDNNGKTIHNEQEAKEHIRNAISDLYGGEIERLYGVSGKNKFMERNIVSFTETFTLDPDSKIITYDEAKELLDNHNAQWSYENAKSQAENEVFQGMGLSGKAIKDYHNIIDLYNNGWTKKQHEKLESLKKQYGLSNDDVRKIGSQFQSLVKKYQAGRVDDVGAFAALLGYDAINAKGHGESGSYTVILNRSKCIFLNDEKRTDAMDDSKITFKIGEDGRINAIRDGEVIGWVIAQEGNREVGHEDEEDDTRDPGGLIKRWATPEYQPQLPLPGDEEATGWLVKDFDAIMSFVPDEGVSSPEWLDDEIKRRIRAVGVLVVDKNGKILTGIRKGGDGENFDLLGGPGGHVEPHESLEDAAIRETYEEFGIVAKNLTFVSLGDYEEDSGMIPAIFLCTEWAGTLHPVDGEMENLRFRTIDDILSHKLFVPFKTSLEILEKELTFEVENGIMAMDEFVEGDHPRAENGQFTSGGGSSPESKTETEEAEPEAPVKPKPSAKGKNIPPLGFEHKKTALWKLRKHRNHFPGWTYEQINNRAIDLLSQPCEGDIDGYLLADGAIARFDKSNGEFAVGYPGGYVKSIYNLGFSTSGNFDINRAIRRFNDNEKADGVPDGT